MHAAHGVHLFGDLRGAAPLRAFEKQMLDEMREAVFGFAFVARAVFDPDAETHRAMLRHFMGHDPNAVVEDGFRTSKVT